MAQLERRNFLSMMAALTTMASMPGKLLAWNPTVSTMMRSSLKTPSDGNKFSVDTPVVVRRDGDQLLIIMAINSLNELDHPEVIQRFLVSDIERFLAAVTPAEANVDIRIDGIMGLAARNPGLDLPRIPIVGTRDGDMMSVMFYGGLNQHSLVYDFKVADIERALHG